MRFSRSAMSVVGKSKEGRAGVFPTRPSVIG
jgi:hypothetical protein